MKACVRFTRIALLVAACFALPAGSVAGDASDRPIMSVGPIEDVIPASLKAMLLEEPYVRFLVTVSAEGAIVDYIATHATHFGLLGRAEKRLLRTEFSPAISNGEPVQATGEFFVTFFDPEQRAFHSGLISLPHGSSSMDAAARWMSEAGKKGLEYTVSQPAELDHPLELTASRVLVMTDADGRPAEGSCIVEFFINDRGEVRLPRIVSSDNEVVTKSALLTILETRFAPLTRNGLPTYVKVRQPMVFHRGTDPGAGA